MAKRRTTKQQYETEPVEEHNTTITRRIALRRFHRQHAHRHAGQLWRGRHRQRGPAANGVPVVSAKQMLTWLDGRNGSSFQGVSFGGGVLRFTVAQDESRVRAAGHGAR